MKRICRFVSLLCSLMVFLSMFASCDNSKTDNSVQYTESTIKVMIEDDDFQKMTGDEQVSYTRERLNSLVEKGIISNVEFDEAEKLFTFEYSDGSLGGFSLNEYDERLNAGTPDDDVQNQAELNIPDDAGLKALVLNGFEDKPNRRNYYKELEADWDSKGLETNVDVDVTVDDLKLFNKYDIIILAMHGSIYRNKPVLCINQEVTSETDKKYAEEIDDKSIARVYLKSGKINYWVFSDFFASEYNAIESDLIFSESCMFYGCDCMSPIDTTYADILVRLTNGDGAVIGYHNSVEMNYSRDVMKSTVDSLLTGDTASKALEKALDIYGDNDSWEDRSDDKYKAYPILTGNSSLKIVKTPVSDFNIPNNLITTLGELSVIEPEINPENADDYTVKWSSSNESVATVSPTGEAGIITTLAKGTTTITAELTSGGKTITKTTNLRVASKARDTVLVLDISGSMYGDPLNEMKKSAIQFCNDLLKDEYNNRVGLVFYDDGISTIDLTDDLDMLISRIQSVSDGGRTDMEAGLSAADRMLQSNGKADSIKNVVVMADGLPNEGKTSSSGSMPDGNYSGYYMSVSYANAVIDTAKNMMNNYNLYSLGFFHSLYNDEKDFATSLMKELTNQTDGYHQVDKAEDLQFAFGDISEDINVGSKIVINIACPVDVQVSYGGEMLSSSSSAFCNATSFGTLQLLGKNKDIKVVSLDSDKEYDVELVGTGVGEMDYSVNYFDESEQLTDYRSFATVPITMTTVIKSSTDNSVEGITLNIDEDGDGEIDVIWTALAKSEGKITYEKNPSEPAIPEMEEPPVEEKEEMPVWVIVLIGVLAFALVGGVIIAVVVSTKKNNTNNGEIEGMDIPENIPMNVVMCERCGKAHPSNKPCDCQFGQNKDQITEDADRRTGFIQVTNGTMNGFSVPIKDGETLYLGKDPKFSNLVFTADYRNVSRLHCAVTFDAEAKRYYVTDSSSNGTYLIGRKRLIKGKRTPVNTNTVLILANDECTVLLG